MLLDCGFGSFESFRTLVPNGRLDAVILSHAHPDHAADLAAFMATTSLWRTEPRLLASRDTIDGVTFDAAALGSSIYVNDGTHIIGNGFEAEFSLTTHQMPTLGVQITMGGSRMVYSADTGPNWIYPETFRFPDVAVVECTLEERGVSSSSFHLDTREFAELVNDMAPSTALLTHVPPSEHGERRCALVEQLVPTTRVLLASVGMTIEMGRERPL